MLSKRKVVISGVALIVSLSLFLASAVVVYSKPSAAVYYWSCNANDECGYFRNFHTGSNSDALWGITNGDWGVYGRSFGTYGEGVYGYGSGSYGTGVYGYSPYYWGGQFLGRYGVYGNGTYYGVYGRGGTYGLYGYSPNYIGVYGYGGTGSGDYGGLFSGFQGVRGNASGSSGRGTWGSAAGTSGIGAYGYASGTYGFGVYGYSYRYIGVRGYGSSHGGYFTGRTGVYGYSNASSNRGVYGYATASAGEGVRGRTGGYGGDGVTALATSTYGYAVDAQATGPNGVGIRALASGTQAYAGYFNSSAYRGIYANGATNWYDGVFPDMIYVGGTVYSGLGMAVIALNDGAQALEPGDLVAFSGFDASAKDSSRPTLAVSKVNSANGRGLIGVVQSAYAKEGPVEMQPQVSVAEAQQAPADDSAVLQKEGLPLLEQPLLLPLETKEAAKEAAVAGVLPQEEDLPVPLLDAKEAAVEELSPPPQMEEVIVIEPEVVPESATASVQQAEALVDADVGHFVEGAAERGQYVVVVVQGIARVKVDASAAPVRAGDTLVASANGHAINKARASRPSQAITRSGDEGSSSQVLSIGHALESLETGRGMIYAWVSVR